jgi:hypothetical protein
VKLSKILLISLPLLFPIHGFATVGAGHVSGKISNITSITGGLLVRIGPNEVPQNCTSGRFWMYVSEENKAMISLTITAWTLGRNVTVYTSPSSSGYCQVNQVDPSES